ASGQLLEKLLQHDNRVTAISYSPDGKRVLTSSADKKARMWDAETRQPIGQVMPHPEGVETAVFSRDGKFIVTGGTEFTAWRWDPATGKSLGQPLRHLDSDLQRMTQQLARVSLSLAVSPDSKKILTGGDDGTARLWDAASGQLLVDPLRHPDWV